MQKIDWKSLLPHLMAVACFILIAFVYFSPVLQGKILKQGDIVQFKGMSKEIVDYEKKDGIRPLWTNSMFGGMPGYQIAPRTSSNLTSYVNKVFKLGLPRPVNDVIICMTAFYILLIILGMNPILSAVGALAFTFSSYNFLIIAAGHNTKFLTIAYVPLVVAGILMTYRGKWLLGGGLFSLMFALNLRANHPQITYYLFLMMVIYVIAKLVEAVQNKDLPNFTKASGILAIGAILAVMTNLNHLHTTYQYSKDTIRGESELTGADKSGSGLDKDYALAWSYGKLETFTLLVPRFMGGASAEPIDPSSKTAKILKRSGQKGDIGPMYWGSQPFTGGPIYHGAIICFLFLLGCLVVTGAVKWWLLAATILSILLSWGKNFELFTDLFFYYFPLYNKFRVVSMTLVIAQFTMPLMGMIALHQIFTKKITTPQVLKGLKISVGALGGLLLIFIVLGAGIFDFSGGNDSRYPEQFLDALTSDRISMLRMDAIRSLVLILLAAGLIWAFIKKKMTTKLVIPIIGLLILGDLWTVDQRYLNKSNFESERASKKTFNTTAADQAILQDKDPNFRVLNIAVNTFNDATTSYHHKSIGGYHGAKLRRYQDLIERNISPEIQALITGLKGNPTDAAAAMGSQKILNMLNTKYIIYNPNAAPIQSNATLGNAWFVNQYQIVPNADAEIAALGASFDPSQKAVIDQRFGGHVKGKTFGKDATASIQLTSYNPDKLTYSSNTTSEQLAIFSEIYYNSGKGWQAYIDGQAVPHFRANYVLRAMVIPAGAHQIEFRYEPDAYQVTNMISILSSLLLILGFIALLGFEAKNQLKAA